MLCRVAENLFWMSRYVERAIAIARLVDVTEHLELDAGEARAVGQDFWTPLLGETDAGGFLSPKLEDAGTPDVRQHLAVDPGNPSSVLSCVIRARNAAREVRENLSSEMWEAVNTTYLRLAGQRLWAELRDEPHQFFKTVHQQLLLVQGLADSTLTHDDGWSFLTLGKYLERADNVSRVVNLQAHLLTTTLEGGGDEQHLVRWLAVLRTCGSAEAYARYYSLRVDPPRAVEFLLLNPIFPQSVRFSLNHAAQSLRAIEGAADTSSSAFRALGLLRARLDHASIDEVLALGLREYLTDVQRQIANVSMRVSDLYFRGEQQPSRNVTAARAAVIMLAAQQ